MQAVEPAACLVHRLANVVRRKATIFADVGVVKGVVPLGEGHGPGIKPGIHHLGDTTHLSAAPILGAIKRHIIHEGSMQVQIVKNALTS